MDKQEIYAYLRSHGIEFEVTEHPAVFHMDELSEVNLSHPEAEAKISSCGMTKSCTIIWSPSRANKS